MGKGMNRSCMKFMYLMKTFLYKCSVFTARVQPYILAGRPADWYEAKFCANFIEGRTGGVSGMVQEPKK